MNLFVSFSPSHRELESSSDAPRNRLLLGLPGIFTSFSSSRVEWLVNLGFRSEEIQRVLLVGGYPASSV